MRPREQNFAEELDQKLQQFSADVRALPGAESEAARSSLVGQMVESVRRIRYVETIRARGIGPNRANPSSTLFDPLRAAIHHQETGNIEEAFWMIFFFVHFGKNLHTGWQLARDVYGRLGSPNHWTWARTRANPGGFRQWLAENEDTLLGGDGVPRHFGNHRKYESIRSDSKRPLAAVVDTYIAWIAPHGSHEALIGNAVSQNGGDPKRAFDYLYRTMDVLAFGRTGKFDYLTMLGKLHLAPIEPGIPYMTGATGPYTGARLLFGGTADAAISKRAANEMAAQLGGYLGLGMQVMEDSLCNWQKSPEVFVPFRG